jgi:hypothetical protein
MAIRRPHGGLAAQATASEVPDGITCSMRDEEEEQERAIGEVLATRCPRGWQRWPLAGDAGHDKLKYLMASGI